MAVEVIIEDVVVTDAECMAVAKIFKSAGIEADIYATDIRGIRRWVKLGGGNAFPGGFQPIPVIEITVAAVAGRFIWSALSGAGDEAGRDGWKRLKRLITGLYKTQPAYQVPQRLVIIKESESRVEIQLPPDLPDKAYDLLGEIESPAAPLSGILKWDNDLQDWTDVLTGKYRCMRPGCRATATQRRARQTSPTVTLSRLLCDLDAAASDAGDLTIWK